MFNADDEFEKLNQQVKMEEEKYLNAEVTIENYKFPHIYLTEEEIEQFNKECDHYGFDIKVVPLSTYMNLNSPDKTYNLNEDDDIDMEQKEKNIDKFMNYLGKNYQKKEDNKEKEKEKENKLIGKKRNKILEDDSEQEDSNISSYKSKSHIGKRIKKNEKIEEDENSEKSNLSVNNKRKKKIIDDEEEIGSGKKENEDKGNKKKKNLIKKKKNMKKSNEISEKFDNYFRKIKETRQKQIDDENRIDSLIKDIMEKSQLLTKEDLKELAKVNHIGLLDDSTLKQSDLNKKNVNQLDKILVDINFNSNVLKLNNDGRDNIKKIKDRMEREKKSREDYLKNKRLKEEKKQISNRNKEKEKNSSYDKKKDKKESDLSDNDSDSDSDII